MKTKLIILIYLLTVSGCAIQSNSRRACFDANITYTHTVNALDILVEAETFEADDVERIKVLVNSGDRLLDLWTDAVLAGEEMPNAILGFTTILEELLKYEKGGN